jgi:hypothetical protein
LVVETGGWLPRIEVAGCICVRKPRPTQGCRAEEEGGGGGGGGGEEEEEEDDDDVVDVYTDVSAENIAFVFRVTFWLRWILKWLTRNECVSYMGRLEEIWSIRFPAWGMV